MGKVRVAEFFGEPLNYGGQESFIINVYTVIDKKKFNFSFITPFECENVKLKKMIKDNNDELIVCNNEFDSKLRKKYIITEAKKHLTNKYDVVHIHSGSVFTLYNAAKIAKKAGIKKVIVHSHATGVSNIKYRIIKALSDLFIDKYADVYFACSKEAGIWKFPKNIINSNRFYVVKNGIETNNFFYNEKVRKMYRNELGIDNKFVIIDVARLAKEKNLLFLIEIFKKIHDVKNNAVLLLVGDGNNKKMLEDKVRELELEKSVVFMGPRNDVSSILQAADVFVSTSFYEGLGISIIEAEASGLAVVCSNNIPDDAIITKLCVKFDLNEDASAWANKILEFEKYERVNTQKEIKKNGYDVYDSVKIIEEIYFN